MGLTPTQVEVIAAIAPPDAHIVTIGHQRIFPEFITGAREKKNVSYFGTDALSRQRNWHVSSLDYSSFEGATIIQDLNRPFDREVNAAHFERYDLVIDSGTLEHVFDVPEALRTYRSLLRVGGMVYLATNANNHFGHGFYQFSSDLFFRFFSPENGGEVLDCFLETHPTISAEVSPRRHFYDVPDPARLGRRTPFVSDDPTLIHVVARKTRSAAAPKSLIQSGYVDRWAGAKSAAPAGRTPGVVRRVRAAMPSIWWPLMLYRQRWKLRLGRNPYFPRRRDAAARVRSLLDPRTERTSTPEAGASMSLP